MEARGCHVCSEGGVINQVQAKVANQLMFQQAQKLLVKVFWLSITCLACCAPCCLVATCNCLSNKQTHHTQLGGECEFTSITTIGYASKNNVSHAKCFAMCARLMDLLPPLSLPSHSHSIIIFVPKAIQ